MTPMAAQVVPETVGSLKVALHLGARAFGQDLVHLGRNILGHAARVVAAVPVGGVAAHAPAIAAVAVPVSAAVPAAIVPAVV
eukprot:CAMPEP_0206028456 /NCGR_PEP_ID=MMETSP1464-20131121/44969_1 /ASSEMBLY_ACC=CAM_ASM_001124 /TAXON_ID=119497 /ORGANISM="Exanthemachrysis gayraliae, Strain RCC1523" /LENGTH=81 /DNA_ID=CAMNT_0053402517 /DNA_START=21 /DNA_END=265 /DNA_ORIENTATION=-